jgi:hypothetical protein
MLEFEEGGNASALEVLEQREGGRPASLDVEFVVLEAADLLTAQLALMASFFWRCPVHERDDTT